MNLNLEVANILRQVRDDAAGSSGGICSAMNTLLKQETVCAAVSNHWYMLLSYAFLDWPEHSGDPIYPVPSMEPCVSPEAAYWGVSPVDAYCGDFPKWDRNHPYGAARQRLLDHLITWFEGQPHDQ